MASNSSEIGPLLLLLTIPSHPTQSPELSESLAPGEPVLFKALLSGIRDYNLICETRARECSMFWEQTGKPMIIDLPHPPHSPLKVLGKITLIFCRRDNHDTNVEEEFFVIRDKALQNFDTLLRFDCPLWSGRTTEFCDICYRDDIPAFLKACNHSVGYPCLLRLYLSGERRCPRCLCPFKFGDIELRASSLIRVVDAQTFPDIVKLIGN